MSTTPPDVQSEDRIRAIAYGLWLAEGRPEGRAEAHWLKANELARVERLKTAAAPVKPKKAAATAKAVPKAASVKDKPAVKKAAPRKRP